MKFFTEFINEAFDIDASFIEDLLIKNKNKLLNLANKNNQKGFIAVLNNIFKGKLKNEKTVLEIDKTVEKIGLEVSYIKTKMKKYKKLKPYLQQELELYKYFEMYMKNKSKKESSITFMTYNTYYNVDKKGMLAKTYHWIQRNLVVKHLKYYEFNKDNSDFAKVVKYDFGLISAYFNFINNVFGLIFNEEFTKKINADNFGLFAKQVRAVLKHELLHQKDFLDKSFKELMNNDMSAAYHYKGTEVKSWAGGAVEELRGNKIDDEKIKEALLDPMNNINIINSSQSAQIYYNTYGRSFIYYKFVSECIDYIDGHYEDADISIRNPIKYN